MTLIEQVVDHFNTRIGKENDEFLGEVTSLLIRRYALAVGDYNPVYFDRSYAQSKGYADIVAPPNLLMSIVEWKEGVKEENLRTDGTQGSGRLLPPELKDVRIMGGGERMEFHHHVIAGMNVTLTSEVTGVSLKEGRKGQMALVEYANTFKDESEKVLCVSNRTIIAR